MKKIFGHSKNSFYLCTRIHFQMAEIELKKLQYYLYCNFF
jgi:hypothetical protein